MEAEQRLILGHCLPAFGEELATDSRIDPIGDRGAASSQPKTSATDRSRINPGQAPGSRGANLTEHWRAVNLADLFEHHRFAALRLDHRNELPPGGPVIEPLGKLNSRHI